MTPNLPLRSPWLAPSPGHASQRPSATRFREPIKEPQRNPHSHLAPRFQKRLFFFFFSPPRRPSQRKVQVLSPLPHQPLSHPFSKQALTRIKEYHH